MEPDHYGRAYMAILIEMINYKLEAEKRLKPKRMSMYAEASGMFTALTIILVIEHGMTQKDAVNLVAKHEKDLADG